MSLILRRLACVMLLSLAQMLIGLPAYAADLPVAKSARIAGDDSTTRFFINFDRAVRVRTFYMDEPFRIIIDLQEVTFGFDRETEPEPRGLVTDLRYGRISKGRSRIVLTLSQPVEIINASMQQALDADHHRFVLDFDSTDKETFARLLDTQARDIGESGAVAEQGDRVRPTPEATDDGRYTVVLDPGHGGIDGGAIGRGGVTEKEIVLSVAQQLAEEIRRLGPYRVLLTRNEDKFMALRERVEFSRRNRADLFISIHADSLRQNWVRGATVYTLAKKASDQLSAQLADTENAADLVGGLAIETDVKAVTDILVDLTTRETKRYSKMFSRILVQRLDDEIQLIKNPQRSAGFGVLKAPDVPGVLLELGYLSNKEDEALLQRSQWQRRVAESVALAVDRFFDLRKPE